MGTNTDHDPFAFYCSKCNDRLKTNPLDVICKKMSTCPPLITEIPASPSKIYIAQFNKILILKILLK